MKKYVILIGVFLCYSGNVLQASSQPLSVNKTQKIVTDMVVDHIDITTGFNGAKFEMYGARDVDGDIIVVLRGPDKDMNVRRKEKSWAGWRYGKEVQFSRLPSFYRVASTKPLEELLGPDTLSEHEIGVPFLPFLARSVEQDNIVALFKKARIRNQQSKDLLSPHLTHITSLGDRFFKVSFYLPHNVPVGEYTVTVFYLEDQKISAMNHHDFVVEQVGTNYSIKMFAEESPLLYGALCVLLALLAGWVSNRLKRIL